MVNAALAMHQKVTSTFLPTAIKFYYIFNLRDLSNILDSEEGTGFGETDSKHCEVSLKAWVDGEAQQ